MTRAAATAEECGKLCLAAGKCKKFAFGVEKGAKMCTFGAPHECREEGWSGYDVYEFEKTADGRKCVSDSDCKSLLCESTVCVARIAEGASCKENRDCMTGNCQDGSCAKVDGVKFKNKLGGDKCLYASENRKGAQVKFTSCSSNSPQILWRKRSDGSHESAANPGLCPRKGAYAC